MKKKMLATVLAMAMTMSMLTGCGSEKPATTSETATETVESTDTSTTETSNEESDVTEVEVVSEIELSQCGTDYMDKDEVCLKDKPDVLVLSTASASEEGWEFDGEVQSERCRAFFPTIDYTQSIETNGDTETLTAKLIFRNSDAACFALDSYNGGDFVPISWEEATTNMSNYSNIDSNFREENHDYHTGYSDKTPEDVVVADYYSGICGDANFADNYKEFYGALDKGKAGTSYETSFTTFGRPVTVSYKYSMDNEKDPCVDIVATYPAGFDGIRIVTMGQSYQSNVGSSADISNEEVSQRADDASSMEAIYKSWGEEGYKDFNTFADAFRVGTEYSKIYSNAGYENQTYLGLACNVDNSSDGDEAAYENHGNHCNTLMTWAMSHTTVLNPADY